MERRRRRHAHRHGLANDRRPDGQAFQWFLPKADALRLWHWVVCEAATLSIALRSLCRLGVAAQRLSNLATAFSLWPDGVGLAFADLLAQATNAFARAGARAAIGTFDGGVKVTQSSF